MEIRPGMNLYMVNDFNLNDESAGIMIFIYHLTAKSEASDAKARGLIRNSLRMNCVNHRNFNNQRS